DQNYDDPSVTSISLKERVPNPSRPGSFTTVSINRPLDHEYHGEITNARSRSNVGYQVFSNDGGFVRSNGDMDRNNRTDEAVTASTNPDLKRNPNYLPLDDFLNSYRTYALPQTKTILLWRPAYNLQRRLKANSLYDIPAYDPSAPRVDSDADPMFSTLEVQ